MKKLVVVINATQITMNVSGFAGYLEKLTHSKLTGIFPENLQVEEVPLLNSMHDTPHSEIIAVANIAGTKIKAKACKGNVQVCGKDCKNNRINSSIHQHHGSPVEEFITESRFADLLIVDPEMSFKEKHEKTISGSIKDVLAKAECPVVIAPSSFDGIDEILFAYDGSASSVFAIKQFTDLFPELADKKTTILQVDEKEELPVIEKQKIGELLQKHYSSINFQILNGKANDELFGYLDDLFDYLQDKKNTFVVMGAFGRNMFSSFFRHSTTGLGKKTINLPIFIAHHKLY